MEDHLTLQQCLHNAVEWAKRNYIPLNHKKNVIASYTSPSYYTYKTDGVAVERMMADLGVHMNPKLLFPQHIESLNILFASKSVLRL